MSRFLKEFGVVLKGRKHLFFLVLLLSVVSITVFAYGKGLKKSVDKAFAVSKGEEADYGYEVTMKNALVNSAANLDYRVRLNKELNGSTDFEYAAAYNTTATVKKLNNPALAINKVDEALDEEKKEYVVNVLFLDKNMVKYLKAQSATLKDDTTKKNYEIFIKAIERIFEYDLDYDAPLPAVVGNNWKSEVQSASGLDYRFKFSIAKIDKKKTDTISNSLSTKTLLPPNTSVTIKGKLYNLDNYIVVPLLDKGSEKASEADRCSYWCKIYDLKNDGFIHTNMTANVLQKNVNQLVERVGLDSIYTIAINGAEKNNKLIFRSDIDKITSVLAKVSKIMLVIAFIIVALYITFALTHNKKYFYVSYVTGTGKFEFLLVMFAQILLWAVLSAGLSFAIYLGICRITAVPRIGISTFLMPVGIIACICMVVSILRIVFWDLGKMERRK